MLSLFCSSMAFPGSGTQWASLPCWLAPPPTRPGWWAGLSAQVYASDVAPQEQSRASPSWSSPPSWAQRWALRVRDWLSGRHFYCGFSDGFRMAGPLLPTPIPKWISSLARGWKESDLVISSSGNSPWQPFKTAWKTGQQVTAIWISKALQTRKGNENQKKQEW